MSYNDSKKLFLETILYIETDKGSGTGFVFNPEGYAITCAHVVKNSSEIYVRVGTSEKAIEKAELIRADDILDLAIIKIETEGHFSAQLGIKEDLFLGDEVAILEFPFGSVMADDVAKMSVSFTRGYISSVQNKNGLKRVLLDVSAKAGNSGSPVISLENGMVVGVLSGSIIGGARNMEEVNYMIPITYILELMVD